MLLCTAERNVTHHPRETTMPEIILSAGQVDLLHDMDLVTLHRAAVFNRGDASTEQGTLAYTLRATCENLIAVLNALPVERISPDGYWDSIGKR